MLGQRLRRWHNIEPTLNKCTMFGRKSSTSLGSSSFNIPAVIHSVCLQVSDQVGVREKGFELLTHRCRSSIYELAEIWELALNEALGMKCIFSINMEYGFGLPTGTITFWGTLVPRILTVVHTFKRFNAWKNKWINWLLYAYYFNIINL